jgi:hypothetical protein
MEFAGHITKALHGHLMWVGKGMRYDTNGKVLSRIVTDDLVCMKI